MLQYTCCRKNPKKDVHLNIIEVQNSKTLQNAKTLFQIKTHIRVSVADLHEFLRQSRHTAS